jgi:hypothetical protein
MSTIRHTPVTLAHAEALRVADILNEYASKRWAFGRQTKKPALRDFANGQAVEARTLAERITRDAFQYAEAAP